MKLVENWRHAWRWWSVRLSAAAAALPAIWEAIPADLRSHVPSGVVIGLMAAFAGAAAFARVVPQKGFGDGA